MAKSTGGKSTSTGKSPSGGSSGGNTKGTTEQQREAAGKGAIREEFLRKKDELLKIKSLDIFLVKDAMGINPKKSDMKPELKEVVKRLKDKKSKGV
ncbi:hypothetical protein [Microcoleus asticus]|uniref:Uncharacterized protein n=1 Tax=Microcoleus asticus IPMA8 TaxID=2563858 RepID=A0ABX2CYD2_9CYAN|nr:hypothetical protein [Microcoleus asticus]NQE35198.1 hypothetical protein [Microcoleus asticus IPMA8]